MDVTGTLTNDYIMEKLFALLEDIQLSIMYYNS